MNFMITNPTGSNASSYAPETIELIADLLRKKWSAAQIGAQIGRTRNAVISIVHRNATLREIGFGLKPTRRYDKAPPRARVERLASPRAIPARSKWIDRTPLEQPEPFKLKLEDLPSVGACKFPIGDPRAEDFGFCGHASGESVYCPFHMRLAYTPTARQQAAKEAAA
jgi:GcrA cell cycle regulator